MLHVLPFILALSGLAAGQQTPPPKTPPSTPAVVSTVPAQVVQRTQAPPPFDEKADAKAAIEAAVHAAATDDIRVLVAWGANDDPGSTAFIAARRSPLITQPAFFSDEYKIVNVNVGHLDRNVELAGSYGVALKSDALPALTVLDAQGEIVANTNAAALRPEDNPAGIDPQKIAAFLKSNQAPAPDAVAPFEAAVEQARQQGKTVFVWFSAPW